MAKQAERHPFILLFAPADLIIVSFFGIYTPDATWMRVVSSIPFWTPTTMLVRIGVNGVAGWEVAMTIALMIVAIFVCAWISARIYRFGILMYGQKPGLGQLAKLGVRHFLHFFLTAPREVS